MKCGDEILVRDVNGQTITRFVFMCSDWWLALSYLPVSTSRAHPAWTPNGSRHQWQSVLGYLATIGKSGDSRLRMSAESSKRHVTLGPVMRVSEFADLLGQDAKLIRDELRDLVIQVED